MALDLIPRSFWNFPNRINSMFEDDEWSSFLPSSGLTVSEDENSVYIEAAVPGVDPDKIDVTFDKGVLWIRGNQQRDEKEDGKKYYRRASTSFSYRVAVPGNVDMDKEPTVVARNGIMKVTFEKVPDTQPKKLTVRTE